MKKSKVLFLLLAGLFLALMIYLGYDISSRTTWPGSKPQLKERLMNHPTDTLGIDTTAQTKKEAARQ